MFSRHFFVMHVAQLGRNLVHVCLVSVKAANIVYLCLISEILGF